MNRNYVWIIIITCAFIFTLSSYQPVMGEGNTALQGGTVTLPLQNFLDLTKKPPAAVPARPQGESVPVKYIFTGGQYTVTATPFNARIEGTVSLIIYQSGWVEVPLVRKGMAISTAQLDGRDLPLYMKDDQYHMLVSGVGDHRLRIAFYVNTAKSGNTTKVSFGIPRTMVSNINASLPVTKAEVAVSPAIIKNIWEKDGKTAVEASLPSADGDVTFSWTPKAVIPAIVKAQKNEKPKVYGTIDTLLSVKQDALRATSVINYSILYNKVKSFTFTVPGDVTIVNISGAHFLNWEKKEGRDDSVVTAFLSDGVEGNYALTVEYEKPIAKINSTWPVPVLQLQGVERSRGTLACYSDDNIEISMAGLQGASRIDEKELPLELRNRASRPLLLAFRFLSTPYQLSLETKKLDEIPVLATTIDTARAITVINDDGNGITTISYEMRNNEKQYMDLALPPQSRLLGAFVNNLPVKPVKGKDDAIKIPLLKSKGDGSPESFTVELTYITVLGGFEGLTAKKVLPPSCMIPISDFCWSLYLPREQRVLRFGGTMKLITESEARVIGHRSAKPASMPAAVKNEMEICEVKKALPCAAIKDQAVMDKMVKGQRAFEGATIGRLDTIVAGETKGVNPVKIAIPQVGRLYRFNKVLVIDRSPQIVAYCYQNWVYSACMAVFFITLVTAGLVRVQRGITRKEGSFAALAIVLLLVARPYIGEFYAYAFLALFISALYWFWHTCSARLIENVQHLFGKKDTIVSHTV